MRLSLLISIMLLSVMGSPASSPTILSNGEGDFSIECNNILTNGIGSSYESHVFSLLTGDEKADNYRWRFLLRNKFGDYVQISDGTDDTFSIQAIQFSEQFFVSINGDLEGLIECDYTLNDQQCSATPFTVTLELKPVIFSISDISIVEHGQYEFSLNFDVHYAGADYVTIEIEEEHNTTLRNYRFDEPNLAHIKTGNITNLYYSWVIIIVSNQYGSVSETLEYAPAFGGNNEGADSKYVSFDYNNIKEIAIFKLDGRPIFNGSLTDFMNSTFTPGLYIRKDIFPNGDTKTSKIRLR